MPKDRNTIAFIKKMLAEGYTQKQISMMTKEHPSRIQRIAAKKTFQYVSKEEYEYDGFYEMNKRTLDIILSTPEIAGFSELTRTDENYIRLIKMCGGTYRSVRWVYADRPSRELRIIWNSSEPFKPQQFDATKIGLENEMIRFLIS